VILGKRKPHVGWLFNQAIEKRLFEQGKLSADRLSKELDGYVCRAKLSKAWTFFRTTGYSDQIDQAIRLSIWLRDTRQRPVVSKQ
jgi:hypothetical protein